MFPGKISIRKGLLVLSVSLFLMVFSFSSAPASPAAVQERVKVLVNGREVDFPDAVPFVDEKGRVQVPARFVAQELGARVSWDGEAATASISGSGKSIALVAGQDSATVNGEAVQLDSGAVLVEDRIYVPARFIVETLGATVQWDENAKTVKIASALPIVKNSGISYIKKDEGWYVVPRTFTAWVWAENAKKVDFYLTPTGSGQEPVKIGTADGSDEHFSITYRLPQDNTMGHFWAVAVNDQGETSTDILNVYQETAPEQPAAMDGVPLHPSFSWSGAQPGSEEFISWAGSDTQKDAVKVILSSWLHAPSSTEILDWYQNYLEKTGWQVLSVAGGGMRWSLTAEKSQQTLTINYVPDSGYDETKPPAEPEKGYRMALVIGNKGEPAQKQEEYTIFTPVPEDALNSEQKAFIEEARKTKGIHNKGDLYVIALGAQPNPGYGLEIVKTQMSWEQAKVYIKLTKPEPGKMYAAVISYPYLVGKVNLPPYTTISFIVEETGERL